MKLQLNPPSSWISAIQVYKFKYLCASAEGLQAFDAASAHEW